MQCTARSHTVNMYTHLIQTVTLLTFLNSCCGQKSEFFFNQPKCCSNFLSLPYRQEQSWVDTLREATYQSVIRHLDYTGTLDGRLDRDHKLWRYLKQAKFTLSHPSNSAEDIKTGVLVVERPQEDRETSFAYHQKENSAYECLRDECYPKNSSLLALWQVHRTDNPYKLLIRVKLPRLNQLPMEDIYEYGSKQGIKKLNDYKQHNSFENQRSHRFSFPVKNKGEFKGTDRIDFPFPNSNPVFGFGRVTPTSFLYDHNIPIGKTEDGWIIPSQRKPHPGVIVDTGLQSSSKGQTFNPVSPFIAMGPHGFRHIIHSLPSIAPPQHLDKPDQDVPRFFPSPGPIRAPPPYKTNYAYDPRFVVYYNNDLRKPERTNPPPKPFKPSTEFRHYSELDPFFHPEGETGMIHTSPLPDYRIENPILKYPQSINDQLPTDLPIENPNLPFKIIVEDILRTTTLKPVTPSTEQTTTPSPYSKINKFASKIPNTQMDNKPTTKPFGEKINPRNKTTTATKVKPAPISKGTSDSKNINHKFQSEPENKSKSSVKEINFTNPPENLKFNASLDNDDKIFNESINMTQTTANTETMEDFTEHTTEEIEPTTTSLDQEITTEIHGNEMKTDFRIPEITVLGLDTTEVASLKNVTESEKGLENYESNSTIFDYFTDETTETNNKTTAEDSTNDDYFSTFADYFSSDTTTDNTEETTVLPSAKNKTKEGDEETQESNHQKVQYRLLTFPGDTVSIVANTISKSVSYRTSAGKEGKVKSKQPISNRQRYPDLLKDYSIIL